MDVSPAIAKPWRPRLKRTLRKLGFWLSVLVIVSPAILVFLWMLSLSLKNEIDNVTYPPVFIPSPPRTISITSGVQCQISTSTRLGITSVGE